MALGMFGPDVSISIGVIKTSVAAFLDMLTKTVVCLDRISLRLYREAQPPGH